MKEIWIENQNLKKMKGQPAEEGGIYYKQMAMDSDLQEILIQKIQNNMNTILDDQHLTKDLFELPDDAIK